MYNLLVSASPDAWAGTSYVYEMSRAVREHTADPISKRFASLDEAAVAELLTFPCLFAHENLNKQPARLGWLTAIRPRNNGVVVEYEIDKTLPPIGHEQLLHLEGNLDLTDWEMNRTHWAVKDVDLYPVLIEEGLITPELVLRQGPHSKAVRYGLGKQTAEVEARPTVFRIPDRKSDPNLVSVMMPFAKEFDPVFDFMKLACLSHKLTCERVSDIWEASEVIQDIFSLIYRSRFVICDFSGMNANVFYEAGIAHTLGRTVIPITQNEKDIPFDLKHHRFIPYLNNTEGLKALTSSLGRRLGTLLSI